MFGDKFGHFLDIPLGSITKRVPLSPNTLTIVGFLITAIAAFILPFHLLLGGLLILFGGIFDMLDGIVARTAGKATKFGAFLDSVLDRVSDALLFIAAALYFTHRDNYIGTLISLATLVGAFLISYIRARAEGLGESCHTGLMERPERVVVLAFGAITGWFLPIIWILMLLTYLTVFQRIYLVWKTLKH